MLTNNERIIRNAYQTAEIKDMAGWIGSFTPDGIFVDESLGITYRGPEVVRPVEIYATAFPDIHRELYKFYVSGDIVVVELALQGTHQGPLQFPLGKIPATGKKMDAPCCDVFRLKEGKIQVFDCYPSGTVILTQLGVLGNLQAVLTEYSGSSLRHTRTAPIVAMRKARWRYLPQTFICHEATRHCRCDRYGRRLCPSLRPGAA
jgi:ketosteroid isomerase-like protein